MFPYAAAIGLAGSIFGSNQAAKAAQAQAKAIKYATKTEDKRIRELTQPYLDQAKWAMPQIQNVITNQLAPKIGKDSDTIKGSSDLSLANIERNKNKALASSGMFWNKSGNLGKARGEALQIDQMATDATNRLNLDTTVAQDNYKNNNILTFLNALNGQVSTGQNALGGAISGAGSVASGNIAAANAAAAGRISQAEDIATLGGTFVGDWLGQRENDRLAKILGTNSVIKDGKYVNGKWVSD